MPAHSHTCRFVAFEKNSSFFRRVCVLIFPSSFFFYKVWLRQQQIDSLKKILISLHDPASMDMSLFSYRNSTKQ
jgi:hypothetical protein